MVHVCTIEQLASIQSDLIVMDTNTLRFSLSNEELRKTNAFTSYNIDIAADDIEAPKLLLNKSYVHIESWITTGSCKDIVTTGN